MIAQTAPESKRFAQKRSGKFVPSAERAPVRLAQGGAQDGGAVRRQAELLSFGSVFFLFASAFETKRKKMNKVVLECIK